MADLVDYTRLQLAAECLQQSCTGSRPSLQELPALQLSAGPVQHYDSLQQNCADGPGFADAGPCFEPRDGFLDLKTFL